MVAMWGGSGKAAWKDVRPRSRTRAAHEMHWGLHLCSCPDPILSSSSWVRRPSAYLSCRAVLSSCFGARAYAHQGFRGSGAGFGLQDVGFGLLGSGVMSLITIVHSTALFVHCMTPLHRCDTWRVDNPSQIHPQHHQLLLLVFGMNSRW